jgi:phage terminase large subunit-like protein
MAKRQAKRKPANQRRSKSATLIELRRKAKRQGWAKWIRQGEGEQADEMAILDGCRFSLKRAQHVVDFFERYGVLTEGSFKGHDFRLLPWQHDWLFRAFGWLSWSPEWESWLRRFRYLYLEVPKKNGKTPLLATLGNYLLFADSHGRQVNQFLAATTRKQAERCLKHAIRAYKYRDDLAELAVPKKLEGFYQVEYGDNLWEVVAADPASADGVNGHVLADEIHRWVGHEFFNGLRWALASQAEGLFAAITTSFSDPESVSAALHNKTKKINAGLQSDSQFYGLIYAADPRKDDEHDPKTWKKANPSLGTTRAAPLKMSAFKADYEAAKVDPTQWPIWKQLRLGIPRSAIESWIDVSLWDAGKIARQTHKKSSRSKKPKPLDCYQDFSEETILELIEQYPDLQRTMALDGATVRDTTAAVFTFEDPTQDGVLLSLPFFWLPLARAIQLQDRIPYRQWADKKFLKLTEGNAVDFKVIESDLIELVNRFSIPDFYFDPLFQAEFLTQNIESETGAERIEFPQTIAHYSPCMKTAERMIIDKTWRHNGHPLFTWQMGNLKAKTNVNHDIRPVKQKHGDPNTVDGPVAGIMTLNNWTTIENDKSFYDDHELESA